MPIRKDIKKFILQIVIPSILTIVLFIMAMYMFVIPVFETNMMNRKKEMIHELTNTAISLIDEFEIEYESEKITLEQAKYLAASKIEKMRYGAQQKDYFWIIDMQPAMVMHPYRKDLVGESLDDYIDADGKKIFIEAKNLVKNSGDGYINYMWQWKDDSTRIVPKLSYVKAYPKWNWIVGTGIYLEDVQQEIKYLKNNLWQITIIILLIIMAILFYVIRQSLRIEKKRVRAEHNLQLSRQKYKSLVEASTEGTILMLNNKFTFSNIKFNEMLGCPGMDILKLTFDEIFEISWDEILKQFKSSAKTVTVETQLKCKQSAYLDVLVSVSKIEFNKQEGYIIVTKELLKPKRIEKESGLLPGELQTHLLLINRPINHFVQKNITLPLTASINEAISIMMRKNQKVLFVTGPENEIGIITLTDLNKRVLLEKINPHKPVSEIMTAPIVSIDQEALYFEAVLLFNQKNISHIMVRNSQGNAIGNISRNEILAARVNYTEYLIKEVEKANNTNQLKHIHDKVPALVLALLESGAKAQNITRIISSLSDTITKRLLDIAIEELGTPPCEFAFLSLGSEGRKEQTLTTDQDNAIVFNDVSDNELPDVQKYFLALAEKVNNNLDQVGFKFCHGEVMAKNPQWCKPISTWKKYFSKWISDSDPMSLMESSIFFDYRCIYGKTELAQDIRNHVDKTIKGKAVFLRHLADTVIKSKLPATRFSNLSAASADDEGVLVDIKKLLFPLIGFVRVYSLQSPFNTQNTLARLESLKENQKLTSTMIENIKQSYNYLMLLRFRFQANSLNEGLEPTNLMDLSKLSSIEIASVKKIISEISHLQTQLNFDFKGGI